MIKSYNLFLQAHESLWKGEKDIGIVTYMSYM